jgi:FKBP-type peptidyl-prolyl cis-trans isomerase 2
VLVHYTGKLKDGSVFDSTKGREHIKFTIGSGELISGFDSSVIGMAVGEKKSVQLQSQEAYGDYRIDLVLVVKREELGPEINPEEGMVLRIRTGSGDFIPVRVTEVVTEQVTIDANHPLAGQDLAFELEQVEITI